MDDERHSPMIEDNGSLRYHSNHAGEDDTVLRSSPNHAIGGNSCHPTCTQSSQASSPTRDVMLQAGAGQQQHLYHTPHHQQYYNQQGYTASRLPANDGETTPTSLGLSMSPPVGALRGGCDVYTSKGPDFRGQHRYSRLQQSQQQQQLQEQAAFDAKSPMSLTMSPLGHPTGDGGGDGGGHPLDMTNSRQEQPPQQQQPQPSTVNSVLEEVAARRSLRSRSQQQSRDTETARRGTPTNVNRRAVTEPRLLWSDLDADGPSSPTAARKRREAQGDRSGEDADGERGTTTLPAGGASGSCAQLPDDIDFDDDEDPRDILAICKLGDKLGIAAYREAINAIDIHEIHAFNSDMGDTMEGIKLLVRPRLILTDLAMATNPALFDMVVAPLLEGGDPIEYK
ncbi:unnamed protein product [Ectocarpus sp. 12 AP-2014]